VASLVTSIATALSRDSTDGHQPDATVKEIGPLSLRALQYLVENGPSAADMVGIYVWAGKERGRVTSSGGGGDYAAQMMLGRLKAAGLVEHAHTEGATRWVVTSRGRRAAKEVI
jgi:hypothetical protein